MNCDDLLTRRLLKNQGVQVIRHRQERYSDRSITISSRAPLNLLEVMVQRRLQALSLGLAPNDLRDLTRRFVSDATEISGDIVLRAAKRGQFSNELIGLVLSRFVLKSELPARLARQMSVDTLRVADRAREVALEVVSEIKADFEKIRDSAKDRLTLAATLGAVLPAAVVAILAYLNSHFGEVAQQRNQISDLRREQGQMVTKLEAAAQEISSLRSATIDAKIQSSADKQALALDHLRARLVQLEAAGSPATRPSTP